MPWYGAIAIIGLVMMLYAFLAWLVLRGHKEGCSCERESDSLQQVTTTGEPGEEEEVGK